MGGASPAPAGLMRERRFLASDLGRDREVTLRGEEAHHLLHVLRLRPGEQVTLFDGQGQAFRAVLTRCERDEARARCLEALPSGEPPLDVWIAAPAPRDEAMRWMVQKLTELGTRRITPLVTERTVRPLRRLERWRRVATEACKQSARSRIPTIDAPHSLEDLLRLELPSARVLASLEKSSRSLPKSAPAGCVALIGPEGGWTPREEKAAIEAGFEPLELGPRTLRVETAAVALAAILQWTWGDLRD